MKNRLFTRNRRGIARRSVSFGFALITISSTILNLLLQTSINPAAQAAVPNATNAESIKQRTLLAFQDCLLNQVDTDGKARDGNNRNIEFDRDEELWKSNEEVIVVGLDMDSGNGVQTCKTIARVAIDEYIKPTYNDEIQNYNDWLQDKLWGKTLREANRPLKVGNSRDDDIQPAYVQAMALRLGLEQLAPATAAVAGKSLKLHNLKRLKPLLNQCYTDWATDVTDFSKYSDDEDIVGPGRKIYANARDFEAKDIPYIKTNAGAGSLTNSEVGDIELDFLPGQTGSTFKTKTSDWYPIGNILPPQSLLDGYFRSHENQTFLDCEWITKHTAYLFNRAPEDLYSFSASGGKAIIIDNATGQPPTGEDGEDIIPSGAGGSTEDPGDGTDESCGGGSGGGALRWILCPVLEAVNGGIEWATTNLIGPALHMEPLENGGTLYEAWKSLRNMANTILVVIFILILLANFFASENSSYTVKKALPRLVAAAILIQASYFLCAMVVDIGNILGDGIGTLILESTGGSAGGSGMSVGQEIASTLLVSGTILGGAVIATILGAWMLLLPLAIGLIISVLTLILSLGVRLIALNLLIMLAPIALLAWILPNTEKYFKMWGTNLLKLVMMYPMIIAMMAAAQVVVKVGAGNDNGTFVGVMTLFAPMIAFFMIPATFKASGTMISSINGAIASKGKSISNATAGTLRKNTLKDMKDKAAVNLYNTQGQKGFRRGLARVASGNAFSFGSTGRKKIRKTQDEGLASRTELAQDEFRNVQNAPLMDELRTKRKAGKLSKADELAMLDLIASRGGTLELADYFADLEAEGKVTRNENGGVENIDDEAWGKLSKKHSAAIAAALPHTTGKAMQSQDGAGLNRAKGQHPANELKREFDAITTSTTMSAAEKRDAKQRIMQQFFDAAQRDDAGSMDKAMVRQLKEMLKDSDAASTTFNFSNGGTEDAATFFARQINNERMTKFVQPS